jgi:hypothetical protein
LRTGLKFNAKRVALSVVHRQLSVVFSGRGAA